MNALALIGMASEAVPLMIKAGRSLADVIAHLTEATRIVTTAQAEGRDITDAELDIFKARRHAANQALQNS